VDPDLYRRRQRRRAVIGWSAMGVVVALVALTAIGGAFGSGGDHSSTPSSAVGIFTASMTSNQYETIREGEEESIILQRLGSVGMGASEVQEELLALFPAQPGNSNCSFWFLSDAPEHLVRLCFDDQRSVLVQKSVAAQGEDAAPKTLA
jgi:hypothetical protein